MPAALNPEIAPVDFLVGRWAGQGIGRYPTIATFAYREETTFAVSGRPFIAYSQQTWVLDGEHPGGRAAHAETGYVRLVAGGAAPWDVELVLAHPSGLTEVARGSAAGSDSSGWSLDFETTAVSSTPSAKPVTAVRRHILVLGRTLRYDVEMAAVGQPMSAHLSATLIRS